MTNRLAIVLAAGKGTRMQSELPKVLTPALGRPMLDYVLDALESAGVGRTLVVVGYRADLVRASLAGRERVEFVLQEEQLGTGHAVMVCREQLAAHDGPVLVVTGDSPLIQQSSIEQLFAHFEAESLACLLGTAHRDNPHGLGRIVRGGEGRFVGIVEEKDADDAQRKITEVNMSTYLFDCRGLLEALSQLRQNNVQREYYITDCPGILRAQGRGVDALPVLQPCEALSVNTPDDLDAVEAMMRELGYPEAGR